MFAGWNFARGRFRHHAALYSLLALCFSVSTHAATGLEWLASQQNPNGSFANTPASLATTVQSTAEVLRTYQTLKLPAQPGYTAGLAYLSTDTENHTEYLARKIIVNAQAGNNVAAWVTELLTRQNRDSTRQNADGGFGDEAGDSSAILNTAFALEALAAARQPMTTSLDTAMGFLISHQQANGAWLEGNNSASLYLTALSLRALWHFRHTNANVPAALAKARDYLLANRDPAGLWGETFTTALALNALIPYLPDVTSLTNSLGSLRAAQSPNGSWNDDPYTTALALRALSLADQPQTNPDFATLQGKVIDAQTGLPLSGVTVLLSGEATSTLMTQSDGVFVFPNLAPGSYALRLTLTNYVVLSASTALHTGQVVDLGTLTMLKPPSATTGTSTGIIKGRVSDLTTGLPLAGANITATGVTTPVLTDATGAYQIFNVSASVVVTMSAAKSGYARTTGAATLVSDGIIIFSPALVPSSTATTATAIEGTVTRVTDGSPLAGAIISVTGSAIASASTDVLGHYHIEGLVPGNVTVKASLTNYDTVTLGAKLIADNTLIFSPTLYPAATSPVFANTASIFGIVVDAGTNQPLAGVSVLVAIDANRTRGTTTDAFGRFSIDGFSTSEGWARFSMSGYVAENIQLSLQPLVVLDLGQVRLRKPLVTDVLPDLIVRSISRNVAPTDPNTLVLSGSLSVEIANIGTTNALANFQVLAFYDANHDGIYNQADVALGQAATASEMIVGSATTVTLPVQGTLPFRDAAVSIFVDSAQSVVERRENNNVLSTSAVCDTRPINYQFPQPVLKWEYNPPKTNNGVSHMPVVGPLIDTNGDNVIDQHDTPAVVVVAGDRLVALRGDTGEEIWTSTIAPNADGVTPALGDIDGDGKPDIIIGVYSGKLAAINSDGSVKWLYQFPQPYGLSNTGIALADLDGDGRSEIIANSLVLNADGTLRWKGAFTSPYQVPVVADLDRDGSPEIIMGPYVYHADGSLYWQTNAPGLTFRNSPAIVNFDNDPYPEVLAAGGGYMTLMEHDGTIKWGPVYLRDAGGAPVVADIDGDDKLDIGVEGQTTYRVFNSDGTFKWQIPDRDLSTGANGSTVFDLDGDGRSEVIFNDEQFVFILNGDDGGVLAKIPAGSGTWIEYPVIADVNNDGHADLVVPTGYGLRVYQGTNNAWVSARPIWNQYTYHITNINDDGSVPRVEQNSWQVQNTYRVNIMPVVVDTGTPNLTASLLRVIDNGTGQPMSLTLRVGNAGKSASATGVQVAFSQGDPAAGGVPLGSVTLPSIPRDSYRNIRIDNVLLNGGADIYAVVDSANAIANECNRANNTVNVPVTSVLSRGTVSVTTDQPTYAPNSPMVITTTVANTGTLPADYTVALQIEDAQGGIVTTLPVQTVGPLAGGTTSSVGFHWNVGTTLNGSYRVRVLLRAPNGDILNEATTGFTLRHPDTAGPVVSLRVGTDRPVYYTHDRVNIDSLIGNLSLSTLIGQASLRLTITDPNGQVVFTTNTVVGQLLPNSLRALTLPYTLTGATIATYQVQGQVLDASQAILASAQVAFEVRFDLAKALTGKVEASLPSLDAGTTQTCKDTLTNQGTITAAVDVHHALLNIDSQKIIADQSLSLSLAAGQSDTHTRSLATGGLATGNYACALMVRMGNELKTIAYAPFTVQPPPIKLTTDLKLGNKGRLLVLLDNGRRHNAPSDDDNHAPRDGRGRALSGTGAEDCGGVKRLGLTAALPATLNPAAVIEARVYRNKLLVDSESVNLASFTAPVNVSRGSNGGDLTFSALTNRSFSLTLTPATGNTTLEREYTIEAIITDGNTLTLWSDTLSTSCDHPLAVGQVHQAFTVSALDLLPAANDAKANDADPHGPKTAPGLTAQRAFLEKLLTAAGWSYTLTDTADAFTRAFHSGGYTTYALLAEDESVSEQTQKELREAVYRGEGLVIAGVHDSNEPREGRGRASSGTDADNLHADRLRDALGLKPIGRVSNANGVDLTVSPLALSGHLALIPSDPAMRIKRSTALSAGLYSLNGTYAKDDDDCRDHDVAQLGTSNISDDDQDECHGHPEQYIDAITLNAYGHGRSGFAGFDLLATATRDGPTSLAADTLRKLLDHVAPATVATGPGGVVPLELALKNQGVAVSVTATVPMPAGMQVMDPGTGTLTGTTVTWSLNLAAGEEKTLRLWVRLPDLDGPVTLSAHVTAAAGSAQLVYRPTLTLNVAQPPELGSLKAQLDVLIQANHPDKKALTKASNALDQALKNITPAPAIKHALKATDALLALTDPAVVELRAGIDTWLQWAAQYAY